MKARCCFCNQSIVEEGINPLNINIVSFNVPATPDRTSQDFYCHFECLKSRLDPFFQNHFFDFIFEPND